MSNKNDREELELRQTMAGLSTGPASGITMAGKVPAPAKAKPQPQDMLDASLNGAQITAAVEVIQKLMNGEVVPFAAIELLTAGGIDRAKAASMVEKTVAAMPAADLPVGRGVKVDDDLQLVMLTPEQDAKIRKLLGLPEADKGRRASYRLERCDGEMQGAFDHDTVHADTITMAREHLGVTDPSLMNPDELVRELIVQLKLAPKFQSVGLSVSAPLNPTLARERINALEEYLVCSQNAASMVAENEIAERVARISGTPSGALVAATQ